MSKHNIGISLSDIMNMGDYISGRHAAAQQAEIDRLQALTGQTGAETARIKQTTQQEAAKFDQEQHAADLLHSQMLIKLGQQLGTDSAQFRSELARDNLSKEHGVASYHTLTAADPEVKSGQLKAGDWLALGADGQPIHEGNFTYDKNGRATQVMQTQGQDPRTGQTSAPIKPLALTQADRFAFIKNEQFKGGPQISEVPANATRTVNPNIPGMPTEVFHGEPTALERMQMGLLRGEASDPVIKSMIDSTKLSYGDGLGGVTPKGNEVFKAALANLPALRSDPNWAKRKPGDVAAFAISTADKAYKPPVDPKTAFLNQLGGDQPNADNAKPQAPTKPALTGNLEQDAANAKSYDAQLTSAKSAKADAAFGKQVDSIYKGTFLPSYLDYTGKQNLPHDTAVQAALSDVDKQLTPSNNPQTGLTVGGVPDDQRQKIKDALLKRAQGGQQPPPVAPAPQNVTGPAQQPQQAPAAPQPDQTPQPGAAKGGRVSTSPSQRGTPGDSSHVMQWAAQGGVQRRGFGLRVPR